MELFKLDAMGDVYADAFVGTESNELLFVSLIGGQTEIRRLQSAITIGDRPEEGGIAVISGRNDKHNFNLRIVNANHLGQHSGLIQKTLFGDLVHLWLYNEALLNNLDFSNGIGYFLLELGRQESIESQVWRMFKTLAEIPLLDAWRDSILQHGKRFYRYLNAFDTDIDVPCMGVKLDLSDGFTDFIENMLKSGELLAEAA